MSGKGIKHLSNKLIKNATDHRTKAVHYNAGEQRAREAIERINKVELLVTDLVGRSDPCDIYHSDLKVLLSNVADLKLKIGSELLGSLQVTYNGLFCNAEAV